LIYLSRIPGPNELGKSDSLRSFSKARFQSKPSLTLAQFPGGPLAERSTLQSILINLRDAAVNFSKPYQTPATIPAAIRDLLKQLGIADPGAAVMAQLENAVKSWGDIGKSLSNLNLEFTDIAKTLAELSTKAKTVKDSIDQIIKTPAGIWASMGASGDAIGKMFPTRLLDYIIYEFLTKSHPKIGGAFLLFGVLRREFTPAAGPAFVAAEIRIFDLGQLIEVITHPREAVLKALKWGTDDFNARPVVDGVVLLTGLIPGTTAGPDDETFPQASENVFVGRDVSALRASALHSLAKGATKIDFVGLHRTGVGILIANPANISAGVGSLKVPALPPGVILALTPGPDAIKDPPVVKRLP
jgi:hypothetical protein